MTQPDDRSRPDFEPPTRPESASAVTQEAPPRRRIGLSRFAGRGIVLVVLVVVAVSAYLANRGSGDAIVDRPSRRLAAAPQPWSLPPSSALPPSVTHPLPTTHAPRSGDPLLRQLWAPADEIYPMDLAGFTFSFRAPGTWGCVRSALAGVRWVCTDESGVTNGTRPAHPSRAMVQSDECKAPCAPAAYADVLGRLHALSLDTAGMHVVDSRTRVADRVDPYESDLREYRMSRTYDSDGDGTLDRHLWVQVEVSPADQVPMQKMLGDLYDATR